MKCPYCGKNAKIKEVVKRNLEVYGGQARARTDCCGKVILVWPNVSFSCCDTGQTEKDDWGNQLKMHRFRATECFILGKLDDLLKKYLQTSVYMEPALTTAKLRKANIGGMWGDRKSGSNDLPVSTPDRNGMTEENPRY